MVNSATGAYISVEALLQLRFLAKNLTLEQRKKSAAIMEGSVRSNFRGRGMEFAEVRPYQAGDDIRSIDWRVTARTQKPYTKLFQEEKERPVYLVIDQRSPMFFGSTQVFKSVFAVQAAAAISWIAAANNDRIGGLVFSDQNQHDIRAKRGKHAVLALIHQMQKYNQSLNSPIPADDMQPLQNMLLDTYRIAKPGSSVFVISDFHDFNRQCEESLALLSRHTDTTLINIYDRLETQLPKLPNLSITNNEKRLIVSGQSSKLNSEFMRAHQSHIQYLNQACTKYGAPLASVECGTPVSDFIFDVFTSNNRNKKSGRRS